MLFIFRLKHGVGPNWHLLAAKRIPKGETDTSTTIREGFNQSSNGWKMFIDEYDVVVIFCTQILFTITISTNIDYLWKNRKKKNSVGSFMKTLPIIYRAFYLHCVRGMCHRCNECQHGNRWPQQKCRFLLKLNSTVYSSANCVFW